MFILWATSEEKQLDNHENALYLMGFATFLEICSEPAYIVVQNSLLFRLRMIVETTGVLVRCIVTYILAVWFRVAHHESCRWIGKILI